MDGYKSLTDVAYWYSLRYRMVQGLYFWIYYKNGSRKKRERGVVVFKMTIESDTSIGITLLYVNKRGNPIFGNLNSVNPRDFKPVQNNISEEHVSKLIHIRKGAIWVFTKGDNESKTIESVYIDNKNRARIQFSGGSEEEIHDGFFDAYTYTSTTGKAS